MERVRYALIYASKKEMKRAVWKKIKQTVDFNNFAELCRG